MKGTRWLNLLYNMTRYVKWPVRNNALNTLKPIQQTLEMGPPRLDSQCVSPTLSCSALAKRIKTVNDSTILTLQQSHELLLWQSFCIQKYSDYFLLYYRLICIRIQVLRIKYLVSPCPWQTQRYVPFRTQKAWATRAKRLRCFCFFCTSGSLSSLQSPGATIGSVCVCVWER